MQSGRESLGKDLALGDFLSSTKHISHSYPEAAKQHIHRTKAFLPVDIAKALAVDPTLVQKPVETFYTRDALQLRVRILLSTVFDNLSWCCDRPLIRCHVFLPGHRY